MAVSANMVTAGEPDGVLHSTMGRTCRSSAFIAAWKGCQYLLRQKLLCAVSYVSRDGTKILPVVGRMCAIVASGQSCRISELRANGSSRAQFLGQSSAVEARNHVITVALLRRTMFEHPDFSLAR